MSYKFLRSTVLVFLMVLLSAVPVFASPGKSTVYKVPEYDGFKSYERGVLENGRTIFHKNTKQYELQKLAKTTKNGFRRVNKRFLVAVGTRFTDKVGQYITIVLKNGTEIPCVVGDIKADKDTDKSNTFSENGCCSEFIVDIRRLKENVKDKGDVSEIRKSWDSPVSIIIVHDQNVFTDMKNAG